MMGDDKKECNDGDIAFLTTAIFIGRLTKRKKEK